MFHLFCTTILYYILLAECKCQVHRETGERGLMCISHLQLSTIRKNRLLSKDFSRGSCEMSTLSSTTYLSTIYLFFGSTSGGTNTMQLQEKLPLSLRLPWDTVIIPFMCYNCQPYFLHQENPFVGH